MMGMRMPETCSGVFKWQVINFRSCCIWLVYSVESLRIVPFILLYVCNLSSKSLYFLIFSTPGIVICIWINIVKDKYNNFPTHLFRNGKFWRIWESGADLYSVLALMSDLTLQFSATHILPLRSNSSTVRRFISHQKMSSLYWLKSHFWTGCMT